MVKMYNKKIKEMSRVMALDLVVVCKASVKSFSYKVIAYPIISSGHKLASWRKLAKFVIVETLFEKIKTS